MSYALVGAFVEGRLLIGQIAGLRLSSAGCELRHRDDAGLPDDTLRLHTNPEDAATIALYNDAGEYRPLKTAPNLAHGWRLVVDSESALDLALDLFYPARRGAWLAFQRDRLPVTPLRETLGRQTGMYRITAKITDAQADALVGRFCRSDGGCLRTILWGLNGNGDPACTRLPREKFDPAIDQASGTKGLDGFIPLLCQEACNLLVAEARAVVKGERSTAVES